MIKNNFKKSIAISSILATALGVGIFTKPINHLHQYQDAMLASGNVRVGEGENLGVYQTWVPYYFHIWLGDTTYRSIPVYLNYKMDGNSSDRKYHVGVVVPNTKFSVEVGSDQDLTGDGYWTMEEYMKLVKSNFDMVSVSFWDADRQPEAGWEGPEPEDIGPTSPYATIRMTTEQTSLTTQPTEAEWPFALTAADMFPENTTTYNSWQHILFEIPVIDDEYDHLFATSGSDTSALYTWKQESGFFLADSMHRDSNFIISGMTFYGDKNLTLNLNEKDSGTNNDTNAGGTFWPKINDREKTLWLRYPEPTMEVTNADTNQPEHEGENQINNGNFQDGYNVDIEYSHAVTDLTFSTVDSLEFRMYGPENKDDGTSATLWDDWKVTDEGITRQYRISPDSPELSEVETIAVNDSATAATNPWLDGTNDGDINIAGLDPATFTPTDPNSSATNYTTSWLHSNSDYRFEIYANGVETDEGRANSFVWPWSDGLAYEGWLHTQEYVPAQPVVTDFELISQSTPHEEDGNIVAKFDYSFDVKSDSEFNGADESPTYISKIELIDTTDPEYKVYATQTIDELTIDSDGKCSGTIVSGDLPAKSNLNLTLRFTYGPGTDNEYTSDTYTYDYEVPQLVATGSRGLADKEITSISQSGETVVNTDSHTASATVDIVVNDIFNIEDGYTAETIPTITGGSTAVLDAYDSSNINYISIVDADSGIVYGQVDAPTTTNDTFSIDVNNLRVNDVTNVKAEIGYNNEEGVEQVVTSDTIVIASESVGSFPPDVQTFILNEPVLDPNTRKYTISGSTTIDIAPTGDADGNGYDGEGDYSPSNVTSVEIWEESKTDAAVLTIDEIDNTQTLLNLEFTLGEDSYEIPAKSDLSFKVVVNYDGGKTTQSKVNQNITVGTRGDVEVTGATLDVAGSQAATKNVGPEMSILWSLDSNTFGYNVEDFNDIKIDVEVLDTYTKYDGTFDNNATGEQVVDEVVATQTFNNVVSGQVNFGGASIDINPETTHDFKVRLKIIDAEGNESEWVEATNTLHYDAGQLVAGAYTPQIVGLDVEEGDIVINESDLESSRDSITVSFNVDQLSEPNGEGFQPSLIESIKLYSVTDSSLDYAGAEPTRELINEFDITGLENTDGEIVEGPDGQNYFTFTYDQMLPNREYTFDIEITYATYDLVDGELVVIDGETSTTTTSFTVNSESLGHEDFVEEDMAKVEMKRTATTATITYEIINSDYEDGVNKQYFENYAPSTVKIANVKEDGSVEEVASATASNNSIQITDIPVGYDITQGNLFFQIYTSEATYSYTDELANENHTLVTDGTEFLASSQVIDMDWLSSFESTDPGLDEIATGKYVKPTFGDMIVDEKSITQSGFKFSMDIMDESSLIDFSQDFSIKNGGSTFKLEVVNATRDGEHVTSGSGNYTFQVSGLKAGTTYGQDWTMIMPIYDIEADVLSNDTSDLHSNISIQTLEAPSGSLWWLWLLIILTIIGIALFAVYWFWLKDSGLLDDIVSTSGGAKISAITEVKEGTVTVVLDQEEGSDFLKNIEGRPLVGIQNDDEVNLTYAVGTTELGNVDIVITDIKNDGDITKLSFKADENLNVKATAKYEKDLEKWNAEKEKAKEEEKEFTKEKPVKPTLVKDIALKGKIDTEVVKEFNGKTQPKTLAAAEEAVKFTQREITTQKTRIKQADKIIAKQETPAKVKTATTVKKDAETKLATAEANLLVAKDFVKEIKANGTATARKL